MGKSSLTPVQLRAAMDAIGIVQEDFAATFNVRQATVSRWLSGNIAVPGYVEAWLKAAHTSVYEWVKK